MAAIARGQSSSCAEPILDVYTYVSATPADVAQLQFQIFDLTTGTPVQVYPATLGQRADVDVAVNCPTGDRIDVGRYVARWTCPGVEPVGTHRIQWFIKLTLSSAEQTWAEEFEVLPEVLAAGDRGYATIADLRDEGITTAMASDARLTSRIALASAMIDRWTGRWFEPRDRSFALDGSGTATLFLEAPIVSITSVAIEGVAVDLDGLRIYNRHIGGMIAPDDREDPRIEWRRDTGAALAITAFDGVVPQWRRGQQNVLVVGRFGYTDPDGTATGKTPELIRHATKLLVVRELTQLSDTSARFDAIHRHRLTEERTRDQSYRLEPTRAGRAASVEYPYTGDPEIDEIVMRYHRPMAIAAV